MKEMRQNTDVDEKRTADITKTVPCANEEADLSVSSSVLEHLETLPAFIKECARALKKDGYFIHLFSCKLAPFALLNQALPNRISKFILGLLFPGHSLGYRAFYSGCYPSAVKQLLGKSGLDVERLVVSYSQSEYFDFFPPTYLVSSLYELVVQVLGLRDLCAYVLVAAKKAAPENNRGA